MNKDNKFVARNFRNFFDMFKLSFPGIKLENCIRRYSVMPNMFLLLEPVASEFLIEYFENPGCEIERAWKAAENINMRRQMKSTRIIKTTVQPKPKPKPKPKSKSTKK